MLGCWPKSDIVGDLYDLSRGKCPGRQSAEEITFYKNAGGGHLDLGTARFLLERLDSLLKAELLLTQGPAICYKPAAHRETDRNHGSQPGSGALVVRGRYDGPDRGPRRSPSGWTAMLAGSSSAWSSSARTGPAACRPMSWARNMALFLDLKLHDIPNTVAGGLHGAALMKPFLTTIHASGGAAMMRAAMDAVESPRRTGRPKVVAVTMLTSMDDADLQSVGMQTPVGDQVLRLAELAQANGVDGVVCSAHEAERLRKTVRGRLPAGGSRGAPLLGFDPTTRSAS